MEHQENVNNWQAAIDELLSEGFALKNHFQNLTLEKIGEILEQKEKEFEGDTNDILPFSPELFSEKDSFDRCKNLYCSLLLEFEDQVDLAQKTLDELHRHHIVVEDKPNRPQPIRLSNSK